MRTAVVINPTECHRRRADPPGRRRRTVRCGLSRPAVAADDRRGPRRRAGPAGDRGRRGRGLRLRRRRHHPGLRRRTGRHRGRAGRAAGRHRQPGRGQPRPPGRPGRPCVATAVTGHRRQHRPRLPGRPPLRADGRDGLRRRHDARRPPTAGSAGSAGRPTSSVACAASSTGRCACGSALDGGPPIARTARTVLVANMGRLQGGIDLFGDARPDDGVLDVAVVAPREPDRLAGAGRPADPAPRRRRPGRSRHSVRPLWTFAARYRRAAADRRRPDRDRRPAHRHGPAAGAVGVRAMTATDWFLTARERDNRHTVLDRRHADGAAFTAGNEVRALVHGAGVLRRPLRAGRGDGRRRPDPVHRLARRPGPAPRRPAGHGGVHSALCGRRAGASWSRGWCGGRTGTGSPSAPRRTSTSARRSRRPAANAYGTCGCAPAARTTRRWWCCAIRADPSATSPTSAASTCATAGATTSATTAIRRPSAMAAEYGRTPPWHDIQLAVPGPAVGDIEAGFRERWDDPAPLTRNPLHRLHDLIHRDDTQPDPLPPQLPRPGPARTGTACRCCAPTRTAGPGYPFAPYGERSIARAYQKALRRARSLIYIEDQYLWSSEIADLFAGRWPSNPTCTSSASSRCTPTRPASPARRRASGRRRAVETLRRAGGDRVAVYGIENRGRYADLRARQGRASSTTPGPASARTTSTSGPGPTTRSCRWPSSTTTRPTGFGRTCACACTGSTSNGPTDDDADLPTPAGLFAAYAARGRAARRAGTRPAAPGRARRAGCAATSEPRLRPIDRPTRRRDVPPHRRPRRPAAGAAPGPRLLAPRRADRTFRRPAPRVHTAPSSARSGGPVGFIKPTLPTVDPETWPGRTGWRGSGRWRRSGWRTGSAPSARCTCSTGSSAWRTRPGRSAVASSTTPGLGGLQRDRPVVDRAGLLPEGGHLHSAVRDPRPRLRLRPADAADQPADRRRPLLAAPGHGTAAAVARRGCR